jgi:hypothetical protein
MSKPWFDPKTGHLLLDEHVLEQPSYEKVRKNDHITEADLAEHALHVADLLRRLETQLSPDGRELMREVLCEIAVLHALQTKLGRQRTAHPGEFL